MRLGFEVRLIVGESMILVVRGEARRLNVHDFGWILGGVVGWVRGCVWEGGGGRDGGG